MSSVDVIVPCYRYGRFLTQCVKSVLSQTGPAVRVLILDDASPDNTAEVAEGLAREDSRVTSIRHAQNLGHIATYNEGLEWASAKYVLLLSADDYLLPNALRDATELMDANSDVGFTFGKVIEFKEDSANEPPTVATTSTGFNPGTARILTGRSFIDLNGPRNIVPTPTAVVRTALQHQVGGYRPDLPHTADLELWLRLAAHASVGIFDDYKAVYRRHANNMSLGYSGKRWLPDFQHRKAALDVFAASCAEALRDMPKLHKGLISELAREALEFASMAFNDGEMASCEELAEFALDLSPDARRSAQWRKLVCKKYLGLKGWQAVQAAIGGVRQLKQRSG